MMTTTTQIDDAPMRLFTVLAWRAFHPEQAFHASCGDAWDLVDVVRARDASEALEICGATADGNKMRAIAASVDRNLYRRAVRAKSQR